MWLAALDLNGILLLAKNQTDLSHSTESNKVWPIIVYVYSLSQPVRFWLRDANRQLAGPQHAEQYDKLYKYHDFHQGECCLELIIPLKLIICCARSLVAIRCAGSSLVVDT